MLRTSLALALLISLTSSACSTVTVRPRGDEVIGTAPDYEETKAYWLWGLIGEHRIQTGEICGKRTVTQVQAAYTFADVLLGAMTVGIYLPRTARVWCAGGKS